MKEPIDVAYFWLIRSLSRSRIAKVRKTNLLSKKTFNWNSGKQLLPHLNQWSFTFGKWISYFLFNKNQTWNNIRTGWSVSSAPPILFRASGWAARSSFCRIPSTLSTHRFAAAIMKSIRKLITFWNWKPTLREWRRKKLATPWPSTDDYRFLGLPSTLIDH